MRGRGAREERREKREEGRGGRHFLCHPQRGPRQGVGGAGRLDRDGHVVTHYGSYDAADYINQTFPGSDTPIRGPQYFGWRLGVAVSHDRLVIGASIGRRLVVLNPVGDTVATLNLTTARRAVPDSARQAVVAVALSQHAAPNVIAAERFADSLPYFGRVVLDPAGGVWVIDYGGEWWTPDSATVFGPRGVRRGRVALPAGMEPVWFGDSVVIGVRRTDDGVPTVAGYRWEG